MSGGNDDQRALTRAHPKRLTRLRKQRRELEVKVRRKRSALERLRAEAETVSRELDARAVAVRASRQEADEAIHAAFASLAHDDRLARAERGAVRRLYAWLQTVGAITERGQHETPTASDASKPPDPTMRSTFLRLASAYHPDKTTDAERRDRHTEIMKELNRAYRGGDTARLLELERSLSADEAVPALDEPSLERLVATLRGQLRELSRQMSALREHYRGVVALEHRRLTHAGCADPVAAMLEQLRRAAADTRRLSELVTRYSRGEVELDELLAGPPSEGADDGWLAAVFAELREQSSRRRR